MLEFPRRDVYRGWGYSYSPVNVSIMEGSQQMVKRDSNFNPVGKSRGVRQKGGVAADWAQASPELLQSAICAAAKIGGALRFGYSRDGGAYAVGIYGDGEPYTEFVKPSEDIDGFLRDVEELFGDLEVERAKPTKAK